MQWNVLVIDDDADIANNVAELISGHKVLAEPDNVVCRVESSFDNAIGLLQTSRFDLLILDLKDDEIDAETKDDEDLSGERVLAALRSVRFTPVIFHSGFAHKVEGLKSPFVRVVAKGETELLRRELTSIFDTRLPKLVRYIEEQQRSYLWDHIEAHWSDGAKICEDNELAYLAARRLGAALSSDSIRKFFAPEQLDSLMRPIELYVWPAIPHQLLFGDILKSVETGLHRIVLTPSCDCANGKTQQVLMADCVDAKTMSEYETVKQAMADGGAVSNGKRNELLAMIRDNRSGKGIQSERFKFLPGTSFLPDMLVDLQQLSRVNIEDLSDAEKYSRVATLDSPFAEALQNRFTQYYGRVGTPDLHADMVFTRLLQ